MCDSVQKLNKGRSLLSLCCCGCLRACSDVSSLEKLVKDLVKQITTVKNLPSAAYYTTLFHTNATRLATKYEHT